MYGSRESRIPCISTKGFFGRYSQRVESIFFFFALLCYREPDHNNMDQPKKGIVNSRYVNSKVLLSLP